MSHEVVGYKASRDKFDISREYLSSNNYKKKLNYVNDQSCEKLLNNPLSLSSKDPVLWQTAVGLNVPDERMIDDSLTNPSGSDPDDHCSYTRALPKHPNVSSEQSQEASSTDLVVLGVGLKLRLLAEQQQYHSITNDPFVESSLQKFNKPVVLPSVVNNHSQQNKLLVTRSCNRFLLDKIKTIGNMTSSLTVPAAKHSGETVIAPESNNNDKPSESRSVEFMRNPDDSYDIKQDDTVKIDESTRPSDNVQLYKSSVLSSTETESPRERRKPGACVDKIYRCTYSSCDRAYSKSSHLKAHVRRHTGEKPYECDWSGCTWKFSRSDELSRHARSHSGVRPYSCTVCDKRFARSDHASKHIKIHHKSGCLDSSSTAKIEDP